ncbi:hypothetical protein QAD02_002858 [Eretmocerus hayati]|uniref:Uncharacterized protein n=2 Tax=Eretmocerus hayati TaxID=131215 RepID=A0ACC2NMR1_9HYME|nr:hypothetical protein QAD02_002858 [Eretmocerus hayati]
MGENFQFKVATCIHQIRPPNIDNYLNDLARLSRSADIWISLAKKYFNTENLQNVEKKRRLYLWVQCRRKITKIREQFLLLQNAAPPPQVEPVENVQVQDAAPCNQNDLLVVNDHESFEEENGKLTPCRDNHHCELSETQNHIQDYRLDEPLDAADTEKESPCSGPTTFDGTHSAQLLSPRQSSSPTHQNSGDYEQVEKEDTLSIERPNEHELPFDSTKNLLLNQDNPLTPDECRKSNLYVRDESGQCTKAASSVSPLGSSPTIMEHETESDPHPSNEIAETNRSCDTSNEEFGISNCVSICTEGNVKFPVNFPIKEESFTLEKKFWDQCYGGGSSFIIESDWRNEFISSFEKVHKFCPLSIRRHFLYQSKDKKLNVTVDGYCRHSQCSFFRFKATVDPLAFGNTEVFVFRDKHFHHIEGEVRGRPVKGKRRTELGQQLQGEFPTIKRLKLLSSVPDDVLENGNITNAPDPGVLRKISSEYRCRNDLHKDRTIFMLELVQQLKQEWPGKHLQGYIQLYTEFPVFYLLLMAEEILKYVVKARTKIPLSESSAKYLLLYLDATGSILKKFFSWLKMIYVYALILPGNGVYPPLEVATFASSSHTTEDVSICLDKVARNMKLVTTRRPVMDKLSLDFSLVLIQSASRSFNGMSLTVYIRLVYYAMKRGEYLTHLTVIHICSTHVLGTTKKKVKAIMPDKGHQRLALKGVTMLVHSTSLKEARIIVKHLIIVFGEKNEPIELEKSLSFLASSEIESFEDSCNKEATEKTLRKMDSKIVPIKRSAFGIHFQKLKKAVLDKCATGRKKNPFYSSKWITYLFDFLLPYLPLFAAFQIARFGILRDSNAPVENYWRIEKRDVLRGLKRVSTPRYVQIKSELHKAKLRERRYELRGPLSHTGEGVSRDEKRGTKKKSRKKVVKNGVKKDKGNRKTGSCKRIPVDADLLDARETWMKKPRSRAYRAFFKRSKFLRSPKSVKLIATNWDSNEAPITLFESDSQPNNFMVTDLAPSVTPLSSECHSPFDAVTDNENGRAVDDEHGDVMDSVQGHVAEEVIDLSNVETPCASENGDEFAPNIQSHLVDYNIFKATKKYYLNFPRVRSRIGPLTLRKDDFATLLDDVCLNDMIINAFAMLMGKFAKDNRDTNVLILDSYLVQVLLKEHKLSCFEAWLSRRNLRSYKFWVIPVNLNNVHWTLLIIVPSLKVFIYLDSCHGDPPHDLISLTCAWMLKYYGDDNHSETLNFDEWTLYVPEDIPHQRRGSKLTNDCGVHCLTWMYIACTGEAQSFTSKNMPSIRKRIAQVLVESNGFEPDNLSESDLNPEYVKIREREETILVPPEINMIVMKKPPVFGYETTLEFCQALLKL